jgi:hypothetical protein
MITNMVSGHSNLIPSYQFSNSIGSIMDSVLALIAVYNGFEPKTIKLILLLLR